jgi:hypothetical protein
MSQKEIPIFPSDLCVTDRRENDRRKPQVPFAIERRCGKDRREERGARRRGVDPTTTEPDYNNDEVQLMRAMDQYKRDNRRQFSTWCEVLEVMLALGYRKVAEPTRMPGLSTGMPPKVERNSLSVPDTRHGGGPVPQSAPVADAAHAPR